MVTAFFKDFAHCRFIECVDAYGILLLWYMTKCKKKKPTQKTHTQTQKTHNNLPLFIYRHKKQMIKIWVRPLKETVQLCFLYYK